jgi:hypothetical protein
MAAFDDVLSIPGNGSVYQRLRELVGKGASMAFLGAGVSFPLYPLWDELVTQLAYEPVRRGVASDADEKYWLAASRTKPLQAMAQVRTKLGDAFYCDFLYETFKDRVAMDGLGYTPAHAALSLLNLKAYITTNYDPGLLEARRHLRPEIRDTGFSVWNQKLPSSALVERRSFQESLLSNLAG